MHLIDGRTADEVWRKAAARIQGRQGTLQQASRGGDTLELLHTCLVVNQPASRWVLNRRPAINPAFALAEVIWILSGRDDSGFLNFWNPALPGSQGEGSLWRLRSSTALPIRHDQFVTPTRHYRQNQD
jgi:thymidylate synthase